MKTFTRCVAISGVLLCASAMAGTLPPAEYRTANEKIAADARASKLRCDALQGAARTLCAAEAAGHERVVRAELEESNAPGTHTHQAVRVAKAQTTFALAKLKCARRTGKDKDVCIKEAEAERTAALADAKVQARSADARNRADAATDKAEADSKREIAAARQEATVDKRAAESALAMEKCDALAAEPKAACIGDAKTRFGKE